MAPPASRLPCDGGRSKLGLLASWAGAALLFSLPSGEASAARQNQLFQELTAKQEECKRRRSSHAIPIYQDQEGSQETLKPEYDPRIQCRENSGEENFSNNSKAVGKTASLWKKRPGFLGKFTTDEDLKWMGACRAAYLGMQEVHDHFVKIKSEFCDRSEEALDSASHCGRGSVEKKCEAEWLTVKTAHQEWGSSVTEKGTANARYLGALLQAVSQARDMYKSDLAKMRPEFSKPGVDPYAVPSIPADKGIVPANGNKNTNTLHAYFSLLGGIDMLPGIPKQEKGKKLAGPLIQELSDLRERLRAFQAAYELQVAAEFNTSRSYARSLDSAIQNASNSDSMNESALSRFSGLSGGLSPLASSGALSQAGAGSSGSSLSPVVGASLAGAPVMEAAALGAGAGAGVAASRSLSGGSGRIPPEATASDRAAEAAPAAPSPEAPGPARLGEAAAQPYQKEAPARSPAADGGPGAKNQEKDEGAPAGGFLGSDGSSRAPLGKKVVRKGAHVSDSGGAGVGAVVSDGMGYFHPSLTPRPAPKAAPADGGNDVASLLGQMKNLFSIEEAGPNPNGGSASYSASGGGGATTQDGSPAGLDSGAAAPGEGETMAEAGEPQEETSQGSYRGPDAPGALFGKTDVSLFSRVRARHYRCMERGLVLYQLKEIVQ